MLMLMLMLMLGAQFHLERKRGNPIIRFREWGKLSLLLLLLLQPSQTPGFHVGVVVVANVVEQNWGNLVAHGV